MTKVAFLADFNGRAPGDTGPKDWGVATCDDDGTNPLRITPPDAIYSKPEWSIDGLWLYCHRFSGGGDVRLVRVPADGSAAMPSEATIIANAGPHDEGALATHSGNLVIDPADNGTEGNPTIWEDLSITGGVQWLAGCEWQTVRNFEVLGTTSGRPIYAPTASSLGDGCRMEYGRAGATDQGGNQVVYGHGSILDLYRCDLFGQSDGAILPIRLRESYIHDLRHWNVADHPEIGGDDHSDGLQGIGAFTGTLVRWCVIYGGSDAILTGDDTGETTTDALFEESYVRLQPGDPDPGSYVTQINTAGTFNGVKVRRLHYGAAGSSGYNRNVGWTPTGANEWAGNIKIADSSTVAF